MRVGRSDHNLRSPVDHAEPDLSELVHHLEDLGVRLEGAIARLEGLVPEVLARNGPELPADIEARRAALRPPVVRLLFVTEPIFPDDPTNFYLANSHLYRSVRGAYVRALGPEIPVGEEFLRFFRGTGAWLVHMPPEARRGRGRPSKATTRKRVSYLTEILRAANPERVIGVKARLSATICAAAQQAGLATDRIEVFPTPRALWTPRFVADLRTALGYSTPDAQDSRVAGSLSLVGAIERSIRDQQNKRRRAREIADDINERGLLRGQIGFVAKAAVSKEIRRHPKRFDVNSAGVRLRALDAFPAGHPAQVLGATTTE